MDQNETAQISRQITIPDAYEYNLEMARQHPKQAAELLKKKSDFISNNHSHKNDVVRTCELSKKNYDEVGTYEYELYKNNAPFEVDLCGILCMGGFRELRDYISNLIVKRVTQDRGTFLDFGSGNGFNARIMSAKFPLAEIHCIDISAARLEHARQWIGHRDNIVYKQMNGAALEYPDNTFDLVYTSQALEQMESVISDAVSEIVRVMKRRAVLFEPVWENADMAQRLYLKKYGYVRSLLSEIKKHPNITILENFPSAIQINPFNQTSILVLEKS